ncbi:unnamed protein product [Thlaspi arvense]|uniref:C-JID domain-containing protein n=1 Tax=Thlaspi arvense TaxID=13288 RepID=A0AAU9S0J0_THLAR|nr:unnamed protein product [Thlaspi arvense]
MGQEMLTSTLVLNKMRKLVSLPQIPGSLLFVDAMNCKSLGILDCSFSNPRIDLNFRNCFKLNQEARNLIIQASTRGDVVLPGGEVPAYFAFRSSRSSLHVKLNEKSLRKSTQFRACILLVNGAKFCDLFSLECRVTSKQNARTACITKEHFPGQIFSEHLYIFNVEAEEVTSTELYFVFDLSLMMQPGPINICIKECGILQL